MSRFQMFDDVEIIGKARDIDVPVGTQGAIVFCFEDETYMVDIAKPGTDWCDALVHADNLRLIRHNEYPELPKRPLQRSAERRKTA